MAFAFLGNSPLQKWGIPVCNFEEFYLAENTQSPHGRIVSFYKGPYFDRARALVASDKSKKLLRAR
jgi:hypothetical protein